MPRIGISDEQRRALRAWYRSQPSTVRQIDAIEWFEKQYHRRLRQSTVSESLSPRYTYLDSDTLSQPNAQRLRQPQWPILDAILFEWHQFVEEQGGTPSGPLIITKAQQIWSQIPQYTSLEPPSFSSGWLTNYKRRHNIIERTQHGEAGSVPASSHEEMRAIQTLCGEYSEEDIYNMDETGLYWRRAISKGLTSRSQPGRKKSKERVSLAFCSNYTGSRRMPIWAIGKSARPYALRGVNLNALGIVWRSNTKAWMNTLIMVEWLIAFYAFIGRDRSVLLLMDNFKPHICAIDLQPPPLNIRIQWLPANSTSLYQPLDQGIINATKTYYKRYWLQYMIEQYEQRNDPNTTVTIFQALKWLNIAWYHDLTNTTIYRCFRKAKLQPVQEPINLPTEPLPDHTILYNQVQEAGRIQDAMSLHNFLNPDDEDMEVTEGTEISESDRLEEIIAHHTGQSQEEIEEEEETTQAVPSSTEAKQAIELLLQYQEYQTDTSHDDIRHLISLSRRIQASITANLQQGTLDQWIM